MIHMSKKCVLAFLLAALLLMMTSTAFAVTGTVTPKALILRKEATTSSKALQTLPKGTQLDIEYKTGDWYKVTYGRFSGYVYASYVRVYDKVPNKGETVVEDSTTLKKGSTGAAVKKLQERLKELGYYNNVCDGDYGTVTANAVKVFEKKHGYTQDGIADATVQKKLYSSSALSANSTTGSGSSSSSSTDELKKGDKGDAVKTLQKRLKELGYYKSWADGDYGNETYEAVKAFQKKNGLYVDGVAGSQTLKKLNSSNVVSANGTVAGSQDKEEDATDDGTLKKGSQGAAVKLLQKRLKELGYYKSWVDGDYGNETVTAVKNFQRKNGLSVNGVAGSTTLKKLNSTSAIDVNGKTEEDKKEESSSSDGSLKKGDKGDAVKNLQKRLKELGYYKTTCDGDYGDVTVAAVKAFQKMNGLYQDGVAGTQTMSKLNSSTAKDANGKIPGQATEDDKVEPDDGSLKKGSQGEKVKELQRRLKELGYYKDYVDGDYGDATVKAVKAFQKMNGLTEDGVAGSTTLKKLNDDKAIKADGSSYDSLSTAQTLKKGDSGVQVKALQKRLKELGYYKDYVDGDYGLATATAVSDFQRANKLTVTGTANPTTLKKMISTSAVSKDKADKEQGSSGSTGGQTYKTESLDWFEDGDTLFRRKTTLKVKDCKTGLIFTAQVLYGSKHLDAEPLTAADTATLLRINGGVEFKHTRRPVLVLYNGHVYAASIYSEPHGDQTILDNNFEGQFCLHFSGSMTHGTSVVDSDHQECVRQAMGYTW